MLQVIDKDTSVVDAFRLADDVLRQGVQGITDLITMPGLVNLDFADVRTIMREAGTAMMGIGIGARREPRGRGRAQGRVVAAARLVDRGRDRHPAQRHRPADMGLFEVNEAAEVVTAAASSDANIIFGAVIDESMGDELRVTVIATGFGEQQRRRRQATPAGEPRQRASPSPRLRRHRARRSRPRASTSRTRCSTCRRSSATPSALAVVSIRAVPTQAGLRRTPLYEHHVALGARMVPFAGWEMPVQYEGVIHEHLAVREDAGAFDVSHMGEIEVEGPRAARVARRAALERPRADRPGEAQYTLLTNERGGIVDDLIVYRLDRCRYLLIVNASNADTDFEWLQERELRGSDVRDVSDEYGLIAVQGPRSLERLGPRRRARRSRSPRARSTASRAWSTAPATRARRASS